MASLLKARQQLQQLQLLQQSEGDDAIDAVAARLRDQFIARTAMLSDAEESSDDGSEEAAAAAGGEVPTDEDPQQRARRLWGAVKAYYAPRTTLWWHLRPMPLPTPQRLPAPELPATPMRERLLEWLFPETETQDDDDDDDNDDDDDENSDESVDCTAASGDDRPTDTNAPPWYALATPAAAAAAKPAISRAARTMHTPRGNGSSDGRPPRRSLDELLAHDSDAKRQQLNTTPAPTLTPALASLSSNASSPALLSPTSPENPKPRRLSEMISKLQEKVVESSPSPKLASSCAAGATKPAASTRESFCDVLAKLQAQASATSATRHDAAPTRSASQKGTPAPAACASAARARAAAATTARLEAEEAAALASASHARRAKLDCGGAAGGVSSACSTPRPITTAAATARPRATPQCANGKTPANDDRHASELPLEATPSPLGDQPSPDRHERAAARRQSFLQSFSVIQQRVEQEEQQKAAVAKMQAAIKQGASGCGQARGHGHGHGHGHGQGTPATANAGPGGGAPSDEALLLAKRFFTGARR